MADPIELGGDVVTGASALAGLFLVYLGNIATAFSSFEKTEQNAVRGAYQKRAWIGFVGLLASVIAAGLALVGKWSSNTLMAEDAIILLVLTLVWMAGIALIAVQDIK